MANPKDTDPHGDARRASRKGGDGPRADGFGGDAFEAAWERGFEDPQAGPAGPRPSTDPTGIDDPGRRSGPRGGGGLGPIPNTGRRAAPRLRVSLPARLISVEGNQPCVLMNLSRSGAQVAVLDSIRVGEGAVLQCGSLEVFGDVIRSDFGLNAIRFEEEISDAQVLEIRHYHETFEERERRSLIDTARKWVTGDSDDDRPI